MNLDHGEGFNPLPPSPEEHAKWLASLIVFASVRENNGNYVQTIKVPTEPETYHTVMFPKPPKHARNIAEAVLIEAYALPWLGTDPNNQDIEETHSLEEAEAQHKRVLEFLAGAPDIRESFKDFANLTLPEQEKQLLIATLVHNLEPLGPIQKVIDSGVTIENYEVFPEPTVVQ